MTRKERVRLGIGLALTVAVLGPLGWLWWDSRLPGTYSVMDMGVHDHGGGPGGEHADAHAAGHGAAGDADAVSVDDLGGTVEGTADVVVELAARQGEVTLASGRTVRGYSLNGTTPGPLIEATVGDLVEVRLHNEDVADGVALHWHGIDVPNAQDGVAGVTQDAVGAGEDHVYRWIAPDAGTYWYHSHQQSNPQVSGGLLGAVLIHPAAPEPDVLDVVAVSHLYESVQTVDGVDGVREVEAEPGTRVRVRVVNSDNGPQTVWADVPYLVRAVDGVDVNEPTEVPDRAVGVPAGGRVDLEVAVPEDGSAVRVQMLAGVGLSIGPEGSSSDEVPQPDDEVDLLSYGAPADLGLDPDAADREFRYDVGRRPGFLDGRPGYWWSVNGELYPDMPMFVVSEGDVVRVTIHNGSGQTHPMHLHGHHAVVLSRDGVAASGSPWWFDSLDVRDGETVEIAFVADNPGIWMDHCHNLLHAREGLVTHLVYDGVTTPYLLGRDSGNTPE